MNRREFTIGATAVTTVAATTRNAFGIQPWPEPVVRTTNGPVSGYWSNPWPTISGTKPTETPIASFKGIPYGLDTKHTRFAAPKPPIAWTEPLKCTAWAPRAPQTVGARPETSAELAAAAARPGYHLTPDEGTQSEDCLHLNVWTPGLDAKKRPVMFYIHGGAYANGTVNAQVYDGTRLARRGDAVVVCVNHRLNSFGYMYLADALPGQGFQDSGNAGQLDLVLALQWVRDNIAKFGGDPQRVMIFGQSGGGAKCATLMAQPPAKGLFHRVITMSGQQVTGVDPAHATARAKAVLAALHLDTFSPDEAAKALREVSMEDIQKATRSAGYFGPVRDGRSLPVDPFSPTDPKISAGIPMILGNMHDETRGLMGQPAFFRLTWDTLPEALEKNDPFLKSDTVTLPVKEVIAKYREWHPDYSASDIFFAVTTDSRSWRGQVIEADVRAQDPKAQPHTWVYQLNWKTPVKGIDGASYGSPHTLDIPLSFDNVENSPMSVGSSPEDKASAQRMADIVSETYIAFARTGQPDNPHIPHWPAYDEKTRATLIFDTPARIEDNPRGKEREYLGQVPYVQPGT